MEDIKEFIESYLELLQEEIEEIEELTGEDFDPCDASGGNFDDAYDLGYRHGYDYGKRAALSQLYEKFFQ